VGGVKEIVMLKILSLLGLVAVLAACGGNNTIEPQRVRLGDERAAYSFDEMNSTWDVFSLDGDQALFRIENGVLEGAVIADRGYVWSLNNSEYSNIAISATVRQTQGSRGNGFGVLCRANDAGDGYYFVISSAGEFAILKAEPGVDDPVRLVDWQPSAAIFQGDESNTIEAVCAGDYLSFSANGQFLGAVRDSTFSRGEVGVVLGAVEETLWVAFDEIVVRDAVVMGG
jgi:hypothetical protein